ncbi:TPA: hypothetical protein NI961_002022 [Pseudomonas aeruginosa]|nr:hypothetical protein [Pseudomonas aeruginosa]HBO4847498.1 hypothetical protein [Pseudomonas aeruginosa]HCE6199793.1 hypothetical protein [Pseudomonas aeruginosa]HCG0276264.1 hypothetical protein [Pseudomonas aeruginosa]HCG0295896.1 hypothetical protein [Pseudomonas aeruginosa]
MSDIVLLDTSVYLNVLDVPGRNQQREEVFNHFELRAKSGDHFLLPMATIWETGNHISRLSTGVQRRKHALLLAENVEAALNGDVPFRTTYFPDSSVFAQWLNAFPDFAQRNKSPEKKNEGISLSDLSIIKEWEQTCDRHAMSRVLIWSLDQDLAAYDTGAR